MGNLLKLKFKEADFAGKDISSLSDTPSADGMSARELKERFDMIPKILIAMGKYNQLIDELDANGADAIGLTQVLEELKGNIQRLFDLENPKTEAENRRVAAESERISAENERKNAEQTRLQKEQDRIGAETARIQSEAVRNSRERDRQHYENQRADAEANRVFEEDKRRKSEAIRQMNDINRTREIETVILDESSRKKAEKKREEAETRRDAKITEIENKANNAYDKATSVADAETARVDAERLRQSAEDVRVQKETDRVQAEAWRGNAEAERIQAETSRAAAERARVEAEKGRVGSEQTRVDNDNYRYQLEIQRQANEAVREENRQNFGYKGDWQNGAYKKYNMVSHKGKVYLANQDTSNEPPHADWVLLSSEGKSLRIGGKYDTVSALRAAYPNGDDKVYIVWGKIYAWTGKAWEQMGDFGGSVGIDKAEVIKIITPELAKKADASHAHTTADITNLLPTITNHVKTDSEIKTFLDKSFTAIFTLEQIDLITGLGDSFERIMVACDSSAAFFGENIAELMEQMKDGKVLSEQNFTDTDKNDIKKALQDLSNKVDKVDGKGLSTNDFTNEQKQFIDKILPLGGDYSIFETEQGRAVFNAIMMAVAFKHDLSATSSILQQLNTGDWLGTILENKNKLKTLSPVAIVNDLTTGGTNKALSAEQGKVLFQLSVDGKRQIAEAINGKTGNSSANSDMTFAQLKNEIEQIKTGEDVGEWLASFTNGFYTDNKNRVTVSNVANWLAENKNKVVVFPSLFSPNVANFRLSPSLEWAFFDCEGGSLSLQQNAFQDCENLKRVDFLNGEVIVGNSCFLRAKKLKTVTGTILFNSNARYCFRGCSSLEEINSPPHDMRGINNGEGAFVGCSKLKKATVTIAKGYQTLNQMFSDCVELETATLNATSFTSYTTSQTAYRMFGGCSKLKEVVVAQDLTFGGDCTGMFMNCRKLEWVSKIDFTPDVTYTNMFAGCSSLNIGKMRELGWDDKYLRTAPTFFGADSPSPPGISDI